MLDIKEIDYWISRYKQEADELKDCVVLSALYSLRDRLMEEQEPQSHPQIAAYSEAAAPAGASLGQFGDSEFLRAIAGKDTFDVWAVMDEHMNALRAVNPRVYTGVMRKLNML